DRATMSPVPPAAYATISWTGRFGYVWLHPGATTAIRSVATRAKAADTRINMTILRAIMLGSGAATPHCQEYIAAQHITVTSVAARQRPCHFRACQVGRRCQQSIPSRLLRLQPLFRWRRLP